MRDIKFRAWDKAQERFVPVIEPEEQGKREWYPFEVQIGFSIWNKNDIVLQQYTGLKDKNGKEIYDGDILRAQINKKNIDTVVVWYMAPEWLLASYGKGKLNGSYTMSDFGYGKEVPDLEVIGNKFENPDLLK